MLKFVAVYTKHNSSVHRNETPITVVCKAFIVCGFGKPNDTYVVEAKVENRVHHSWHRKLGSRSHRDQQWSMRIAKFRLHLFLQKRNLLQQLGIKCLWPATLHVSPARIGGHSKPMWHWQLEHARHFCQIGALAAEQIFHLHRRFAMFVIKRKNKRHATILRLLTMPYYRAKRERFLA